MCECSFRDTEIPCDLPTSLSVVVKFVTRNAHSLDSEFVLIYDTHTQPSRSILDHLECSESVHVVVTAALVA